MTLLLKQQVGDERSDGWMQGWEMEKERSVHHLASPPWISIILKDLKEDASVRGEEGGEDEGLDCHELDENVERWPGGVLQGIADGVTNNCSLVGV